MIRRFMILIFAISLIPIINANGNNPEISIDDVEIIDIGTVSYANITVDCLPDGFSGYNLSVTILNFSIAKIKSVFFPSWAFLTDNPNLPSSSCWIKAVDITKLIEYGATNITLASLIIESINIGQSSINITVTRFDDDDGYPMNLSINNATLDVIANLPPNNATNPDPIDNSTGININTILSWTCSDPNNEPLKYDIFFGTQNPLSLSASNISINNYNPGTLNYETKYYWKIVAWDNKNESSESQIWSFTTKDKPSGGSGGGSGGGFVPIGPTNQPPIAKINVSENSVFIGEVITFNGNGSYDQDGDRIANWTWDFGDGNKGYGSEIKHSYLKEGSYAVTLTVKDEKGATDSESVDISIVKPNIPPLKPTISGPTTGNRGNSYSYTITSTDADNDTIQYMVDWGDNSLTTTQFFPNGTAIIQNHSWISAGKYSIKVQAYDNETISETSTYLVLIDALLIDNASYLLDKDSDGVFDSYYSDTNDDNNIVEKNEDGSYIIDTNGDGKWDYTYTFGEGLAIYPREDNKGTPGFEITLIFLTIAFIIIWKRQRNIIIK